MTGRLYGRSPVMSSLAEPDRARWSAPPARRPSAAWWSCRSPTGRAARRTCPAGTVRSRSSTAVKAPNRLRDAAQDEVVTIGAVVSDPVSPSCQPPIAVKSVSYSFAWVVVQRHEGVRLGQHRLVGEDQRVLDQLGVDLLHRLLRTLDRADVVHPGGQLGGDLRVVVVVHQRLGVGLVVGLVRHQHVVRPEHQALFGHDELDVRVVGLQRDDVAGPRLAGGDVAGVQVLHVVVAGEPADLPGRRPRPPAARAPCSTRRR